MSTSLLLVEDEAGIAETLGRLLTGEGYEVRIASSLKAARQAFAEREPALVLLDWTLPDGAGLELLRAWRQAGVTTPVVMVTARADLIDKVLGLELGADDYVTKPFEPRELVARIKVRLRAARAAPPELRRYVHAGITLDDDAHIVTWQGAPVDLTRMEYALLKLFVENAGKVFTRNEILNRVWGFDAYPTTRTVDTHVLQLRQKFSPDLFETVRGVGYRMAKS